MAQQDENSDSAEEIQRQFALLQEEMRRVMRDQQPGTDAASLRAQPVAAATAEEEAQFRRIEAWLEELRRGTDQQVPAGPADPAVTEALGRLRASVEQIAAQSAEMAKRSEESAARLARTVQTQRQAIADVTSRVDQLSRRRGQWMTPVAILLGALVIAAAVLVSNADPLQMLIDRFNAIVFPDKPHADTAGPAAVAQQAPTGSSQSSPAESPPTAPPSPATIPAPLAQTANQPPPPVVTPAALPAPTPGPVQAMSVPDPPKALPAPPPAQTPPSATPPAAVADAPTSPTPKDPAAQDLAALTPPAPSTLPAPAPAPAPAQMPAVDPPPARSHIVLRANSDTWVEVRNRQGGMLLSRTLHSGDSWSVPDQGSLMLSTGNAGGLEVLIDGSRAPSLGASGAVRRDVPLDADLLRAGRPAPEPSTRARPSTASR